MSKDKTATLIALFMMFAMVIPLVTLPTANAQEGTYKTYAFIGAVPDPVGVGQELLLHTGISTPLANVQLGWQDVTVTVTRPDEKTETLGPLKTDSTGGTGTIYVPTMTGTYYFQTHFPQQLNPAYNSRFGLPEGAVMLASDSEKLAVAVQEDPVAYYPGHPLPTEFWSRPIDAQLWEWASISGNWLERPSLGQIKLAPYNDGPETAHILWAKVLAGGGLAGGELGPHSYEDGAAYEYKFDDSIIIGGVLYYNRFESRGGTDVEQDVVAVDLHTGEELWMRNWNNTRLSFGQAFYWDSYNYHGVFGYLWSTSGNTWNAYDATTGRWIYRMTNVPSGSNMYGPNGEIYRYSVNTGNGWMTLWNSTKVVSTEGSWRPHGNTYDCSWTAARQGGYEWNITIPTNLPGSAQEVVLGDRVFGASVSVTEVDSWAFSLEPGREGQLLFSNTWNAPAEWAAGNVSVRLNDVSLEDGVFVVTVKESRQHYGFSVSTGQKIWGPTEPQHYLDMYQDVRAQIVYGRLISGGMSGIVSCYNVTTGELLWTWEDEDIYCEIEWSNNFPRRDPAVIAADGKIYTGYYEHSPIDPKARGASFSCIDVETGEKIWSTNAVAGSYYQTAMIGDSVIVFFDAYDNRVYAFSKGPSATIVEASPKIAMEGSSIMIEGMVTDISPGTYEYRVAARFPNGVPVVSDANMTVWMQYVYKQFERPTDVNGVEVVVEVLDPNNNRYEVGRTTSDASGFYSCEFTPEVPGKYTIISSFEGSEAYYGSFAETAVSVKEAPTATPEPTPTPASAAELYLVPGIAGVIVAIAVVGAILMLMLRRR